VLLGTTTRTITTTIASTSGNDGTSTTAPQSKSKTLQGEQPFFTHILYISCGHDALVRNDYRVNLTLSIVHCSIYSLKQMLSSHWYIYNDDDDNEYITTKTMEQNLNRTQTSRMIGKINNAKKSICTHTHIYSKLEEYCTVA
jgi:hypothetical protein